MFETEDMLPRAAPKPSAPVPLGHTEQIVKPTVPEVSLLFGMPPSSQATPPQQPPRPLVAQPEESTPPTTTFASWKKQMLPRVTFPPVLATELGPLSPASSCGSSATASTEYIMQARPKTQVQPSNANTNVRYIEPTSNYQRNTINPMVLRRSLDAATLESRFSMPMSEVLTICAGTQTDAVKVQGTMPASLNVSEIDLSNLVKKEDLAEVLTLLTIIHQEQQHLRRLCETIVQQPHMVRPCKDIGTQCDIVNEIDNGNVVKRLTPIVKDYIAEEQELPQPIKSIATRMLPRYVTPRATPPMAQSTGYRTNTPQRKPPSVPSTPTSVPRAPVSVALSKPNTEKSMVMNELALKYLPQQQLDEFMQELCLASPSNNNIELLTKQNVAPLRPIDNLKQSPNDMSNASYKYLKKYRLLPEEQLMYAQEQENQQSPLVPPQLQRPMLDLENIRNQPKLL